MTQPTEQPSGTVHELKTIPPYFEDVITGRKPFEVRRTLDRTFAVGDTLRLREWQHDQSGEDGTYTGRETRVRVTYILTGPGMGVPANLAVMGIAVLAGIRPVTYYEAWCFGDGGGEHQLQFGDFTAYGQREGVESDLDAEDAVVLADGRAFCALHIPADVCPDAIDNRHEREPDDDDMSCMHCGAEPTPVGAAC